MTAKVILNPYAGRWKAKERKGEVISALRDANVKFELVETLSPGHGSELAEDAVIEGFSPIIVAGGDGSVSEVVNGMMSCIGKADIQLERQISTNYPHLGYCHWVQQMISFLI
jgi:diacylglycerol kinase (ATP)